MSVARLWSICHHPSARFTRVIALKLRSLHRMGCPGALSDPRFREPSAAPCRAVNHALATQDARLERRGDQSRAEGLIGSGVQLRRTEGHTEALAPQDYAAERVGVGVVGHGVIGVTPVGA